MPKKATHEDANLILRLYELRREPKLRQARDWFAMSFNPQTMEEAERLCPPGSDENAYYRMITSYWEMASSLVTSGALNQELFFENCGEFLFTWQKVKHLVPQYREAMTNPLIAKNSETVGKAFEEWYEERAPGALEAGRERLRKMGEAVRANRA